MYRLVIDSNIISLLGSFTNRKNIFSIFKQLVMQDKDQTIKNLENVQDEKQTFGPEKHSVNGV